MRRAQSSGTWLERIVEPVLLPGWARSCVHGRDLDEPAAGDSASR